MQVYKACTPVYKKQRKLKWTQNVSWNQSINFKRQKTPNKTEQKCVHHLHYDIQHLEMRAERLPSQKSVLGTQSYDRWNAVIVEENVNTDFKWTVFI